LREERKLRVFENRVLRRIFGLKEDEITKEWIKIHNEELNNLHFSPDIIWVIKWGNNEVDGHVPCMGREEVHIGFWRGNLKEIDHLEVPDVNGSIILR
jgi:hypothetical protein